MRVFMERFAKDNNFDPLVAENWYQYSRLSIAKLQVSHPVFIVIYVFLTFREGKRLHTFSSSRKLYKGTAESISRHWVR